jgi:signal transduction histidine kinase
VACEFRSEGGPPRLGNEAARHLVRIAQEAVRNAVRHGKARDICITLRDGPEGTTLSVRDDGTGLPPSPGRGSGLGLRIMSHRAQLLHGEFQIEAAPQGGTLVSCLVPAAEPAHGT